MDPKDYLLAVDEKELPNECSICIFEETEDPSRWMLGDAFLRGWYSTYDYDKKLMGFAPHATSTKDRPVKGEVPSDALPGGGTDWVLVAVIITIAVVAIALAITFIFLAINGKLDKGNKGELLLVVLKK
jgi:hypothetical protein